MKKLSVLFVLAVLICLSTISNAQKIATVDFDSLITILPQMDSVKKASQAHVKQLESQMMGMQTELQTKYQDYQTKEKEMTDLIKGIKKKELEELNQRIQDFQASAQQEIQKKNADLAKPLQAKVKKAIEQVAKEKGYKIVLDSGAGNLLYSEQTDNIFAAVKAKLGLK